MSSFASLRGHLLVAAPDLLDPNFRRSVVLLTEHDAEAAMGVVLNRRLEVTVADAVPALAELVEEGAALYQGGPVQTGSVLALADFHEPSLSAGLAFGSIGYLRGDEDPGALVGDVGAVRVFSGYSGWGPGQLEAELAVRDRGALLEHAEGADDRTGEAEPVDADREVLDRALGLRTPVAVGRNVDRTHRVGLGAEHGHGPEDMPMLLAVSQQAAGRV